MTAENNRFATLCGLGLLGVPVLVWLTVLGRVVENLPAADDHYSLLPFLNHWQESSDWSARWSLLFAQFNDHRIVFTKVLTLLDWRLFGQLNFAALQIAGWLAWLLVAVGLVALTPAVRRHVWLGLPVMLLLLHTEGCTNFLIALDMGNLWVVTFAFFAATSAWAANQAIFAFAVAMALLSALAFTNGLLVFPSLALGLLLRRRFARAALIGAAGAFVWSIYFFGYRNPLGAFSAIELIKKSAIMSGGLLQLARMPDIVTLCGGAVLLLIVAIFLLNRRLWRELPGHGVFLLFLVLSVVTAARGRAGWDDYYMTQDRYRLYGLLMLATVYVICVEFFAVRRRLLGVAGTVTSLLYCFLAYASFNAPMLGQQSWSRVAALNWQLGECFANVIARDWPIARAALQRSEELGVYHFPALLSTVDLSAIRNLVHLVPASHDCALEPNGSALGYYVRPPAGHVLAPAPDFGVLITQGRPVILPVEFFRARTTELVSHPSGVSPRFGLVLPKSEYTLPGRHAVYGLHRDPSAQLAVVWSGTILIP